MSYVASELWWMVGFFFFGWWWLAVASGGCGHGFSGLRDEKER